MSSKNVKPASKDAVKPGSSKDDDGKLSKDTDTAQPQAKTNTYPADDQPRIIMEMLDRCRASGEFCDVQLKLSPSNTVYAHKAILSACSPYFEGMFTSSFMEATSDFVDMSHTTENPEVLESVINSFYGQQFEITEENAGEVMNLATMLLIDDLREACGRVMRKTVTVSNAAEMLQLAFSFQIDDLKGIVTPILYSRFHDYIMLQEDLVEMGTECFDYLLKSVNTGYVSRKAEFIKLILNWFSRSESDERAKVAINGLQFHMNFDVTNYMYNEVEKDINEVVEHLKEVNSVVSQEMREKFLMALEALKPVNYNPGEDYDSDIEDSPDYDVNLPTIDRKRPFIGPRIQSQGYTQAEEEEWKTHRGWVEQFNHWDKRWWDLLEKRKKENPNFSIFEKHKEMDETRVELNNIKRHHDAVRDQFKKRDMRIKTGAELEEESRLLDMVVVLAPSLEMLQNEGQATDEDFSNDEMVICAYVTRKKAWYKLGTLRASEISKSVRPDSGSRRSGQAPGDHEELEELLEYGGADLPEMMMMMEDMPGPYRRRMMEHMSRRHMPPRMLHRMMRDMDDDDMPGHPMMMMMGGRGGGGYSRGKMSKTAVTSLLKGRWRMVYYRQQLFFWHREVVEAVWSWHLELQCWSVHSLNTRGKKREDAYMDAPELLELLVTGGHLYVVLLITMTDTRNDFWSRRDRSESISNSTSVKTRYKIMRLSDKGSMEAYFETQSHDAYVDNSQFEPQEEPKDRFAYMPPPLMKRGVLKMVLFCEDEEKLLIFLMVRTRTRGVEPFNLGYLMIVYLDLREDEYELDLPHNYNYSREITPLLNDDQLTIVNDDLSGTAAINLGTPGTHNRCKECGGYDPDTTHFRDAEELYPKCPSLVTSNGRKMWILEGSDRDVSEMTIVSSQFMQGYFYRHMKKVMTAPPPFKCFSMACPGQIDRHFLRRHNPPTKYLHA